MTTPEQLVFCKGWYVRKPSPNDPKSPRLISPFALIKYNKLQGNLSLHLDLGAHRCADHKQKGNPKCKYSRASPITLKKTLLWQEKEVEGVEKG